MAAKTDSRRIVLVTGDLTMDWNIAHLRRVEFDSHTWNPDDWTRACWQPGGAALLGDLIEEVTLQMRQNEGEKYKVNRIQELDQSITTCDKRFHHSYALWSLFKYSKKASKDNLAWRVSEFIGMDRSNDGWTEIIKQQLQDVPNPELIVLDDAALGFRDHPELWSGLLKKGKKQPWILLKMSRPIAQGQLFEHLHQKWAERLIVVMGVNDLRRTEVQISRALSWERTAQDLVWELVHNPRVNALSDCAHVIIPFDTAGALLLSKKKAELFYDTHTLEGMWAQDYPGGMIGYNSCLMAGIVRQLMLSQAKPDIHAGIQSGLSAMRKLHQEGYGDRTLITSDVQLSFPVKFIAAEVMKDAKLFAMADVQDPVYFLKLSPTEFAGKPQTNTWTILQDKYSDFLNQLAQQIVLEGPDFAMHDVPLGKFRHLLTADRREIESFRSISSVIGEYCSQSHQKHPLSIAVFGAPGSGKSFGITEIAESLSPDLIKKMEFNLSQLSDVEALHDALHQVRDVGLSGKIPLVFWDEFDTAMENQPLGWLRHFLAPMQDGAFQQGQITHSIGPAIFIFAGGTSESMETFGQGIDSKIFRDIKGPDFVSRLKGFVNILGPNPIGGDISTDPHFVIRRAILLRSLLVRTCPQLSEKKDGKELLNIDSGVLLAFLTISKYKHGARSMESILAMSLLSGKNRLERSCLPPEAQLNLHVNGLEFQSLVQQIILTPEILEKLAEAAHQAYCDGKKRDGWRYGEGKSEEEKTQPLLVPYDELPEWAKESNRVNVRTIPKKLAAAGYIMVPSRSNQPALEFPGDDLEKLAQLEHDIFVKAKLDAGFKLGKPTKDDPYRNEYLVEWEQLPDGIKQIDNDMVRGIPRILSNAGYAIEKTSK